MDIITLLLSALLGGCMFALFLAPIALMFAIIVKMFEGANG